MRLYGCLLPLPGRSAPLLIGAMLLACLVALKADVVQACCPAGPPGVPVANADQAVIMIWDADNKTQHFIRQASFKTAAADFGFLIPSPTQPELAESGNEAFDFLDRLTQPPPTRDTDGKGNKNATPDDAAVTVLERKLVAGFDAAVLEARSATALVDWLKKNGYAYSPEIKDWAKPYIDAGWKFTALKVAKDKNSKDSKDVAASALRMSFKTDRPLFPYREPDYKNTAASLGAKKRLLRIFFIAEARYQGDLTKETPWTGKVVWAGPIDAAARKTTLEMLKLPETTGPKKWFLTKFDDNWPYKVAPADIYFTRSQDQSEFLGYAHDEPAEKVIGALDGAQPPAIENGISVLARYRGVGGTVPLMVISNATEFAAFRKTIPSEEVGMWPQGANPPKNKDPLLTDAPPDFSKTRLIVLSAGTPRGPDIRGLHETHTNIVMDVDYSAEVQEAWAGWRTYEAVVLPASAKPVIVRPDALEKLRRVEQILNDRKEQVPGPPKPTAAVILDPGRPQKERVLPLTQKLAIPSVTEVKAALSVAAIQKGIVIQSVEQLSSDAASHTATYSCKGEMKTHPVPITDKLTLRLDPVSGNWVGQVKFDLDQPIVVRLAAQAGPIMAKYKGRIATEPFPLPDKNAKAVPFQKETVITNQAQYDLFVARLPKMEPLNTKGDDHPNDDPLLKKPPVNFADNMVLAVTRDNMYLPPDITHMAVSDGSLVVHYTEEELGEVANYQQQGGLGTYCAVVVPKTTRKIVFRGTTTKSSQPGDGARPAKPKPNAETGAPAQAVLSLTLAPAKGLQFTFGTVAEAIFTVKNLSDKAVNVGWIVPVTNRAEETIALSGRVYGDVTKDDDADRYRFHDMNQQESRMAFHVGFLLPGQEVAVRATYRPLFATEQFLIQYFEAAQKYDGTAASLAPLKPYIPRDLRADEEASQPAAYVPFDAQRWLAVCKANPTVSPPGPDAPERAVLLPGLGERARFEWWPAQEVAVAMPLAIEGKAFPGEKALAAAAKITGAPPHDLDIAYSAALGGYAVTHGAKCWLLTSATQAEPGSPLLPVPPELLKDVDLREDVRVQVGQKQEGFGSVRPSGRKLWDKYAIEYGDGMYTQGEFIRIDKGNLREFLRAVQARNGRLGVLAYYFRSRYFTLSTAQNVGVTPKAPQRFPDPIDELVARLNASNGLWINGLYPTINLPPDAKPEEVLAQAIKMTGFDRGHIKTFVIQETRQVQINTGRMEPYSVVLLQSDLGKKIFLFKPENNNRWWTRFYDVPSDRPSQVPDKNKASPDASHTKSPDHLPYTSELVDAATLIGAWSTNELAKEGGNLMLRKPSRVFKGDPLLLRDETRYTRRLQDAIGGIAGRGAILFVTVREGRADLVADLACLPWNGITEKAVSHTVAQLTIRATWNNLSVRQQIENSDIIVAGSLSGLGEHAKSERPNPTVTVENTFRGAPPKAMVVLPGGPPPEKGQALFLIQRYCGSGPDYMVMHCVPLNRATPYFAILGTTGVQEQGRGKSAEDDPDGQGKELLKNYRGDVVLPPELRWTYTNLVVVFQTGKQQEIETFCLPGKIKFTTEPRTKEGRNYGQDINLPFLKDGFHKFILNLRKGSDAEYLIRTGSTALWFTKTQDGKWRISKYLDKPIE